MSKNKALDVAKELNRIVSEAVIMDFKDEINKNINGKYIGWYSNPTLSTLKILGRKKYQEKKLNNENVNEKESNEQCFLFKALRNVYGEGNIGDYIESLNENKNTNKYYFEPEYRFIDAIVWKRFSDKPYNWYYDFLIEHENDEKDWLCEMQKLCTMNAKNKLLISYDRLNDNNEIDVEACERMLRDAAEIKRVINPNAEDERFILMLGKRSITINSEIKINSDVANKGSFSVYTIYELKNIGNEWKFEKITE